MSTKLTADLNAVQNAPIELEYLNGDLNIIQKLDDEPNDVGGLSSAQLKAKFDEAGNVIKEYINNGLIPAILAADATEIARTEAEAARETAEQGRETAETRRNSSEQERESSEEARASAETARGNAESARSAAEASRETAEDSRATAESQREQYEAARKNAENARATAESGRASAEASRASAETQREESEAERASAEASRANAEAQRQANETARQSAENARNAWSDYYEGHIYDVGNKVAFGGSSYVCIKRSRNKEPTNAEYWQLIAQRGNDGKGAPSDSLPKAPGAANAGSEEAYSRSDHVHPKELPSGGSAGQVLQRAADGCEWGDAPAGVEMYTNILVTNANAATYANVIAALDAGKLPVVRYGNKIYIPYSIDGTTVYLTSLGFKGKSGILSLTNGAGMGIESHNDNTIVQGNITAKGILKGSGATGNPTGNITAAVAGADYIASGNITRQTLVSADTTPEESYAINWTYG